MPALAKKIDPRLLGGALALVLLIIAGVWWTAASRWQSTDNAYVSAESVSVTPQVGGRIVELLVKDNQMVSAGDLLARIDPSEARAQVAQAQAELAAARAARASAIARTSLEAAQVRERAAALESAQAGARLAQADKTRNAYLAQRGFVSAQRLQTVDATAQQAAAGVSQAQAALAAQRRSVAATSSERGQTDAAIQAAQARLDEAKLALGYTEIRAPRDGVVGALAARVGATARLGQPILSIVPLGEVYVVANFKETQLASLKLGQTVVIHADAFPGKEIRGRVQSFAPASGSEFALIPVEHATGNFTKITQRVPVRIAIDPADPMAEALRPGLSVEARVDLQSPGGASFADAARRPEKEPGPIADAAAR